MKLDRIAAGRIRAGASLLAAAALAIAAAALAIAAPALAQDTAEPPEPTVGAVVYGTGDVEVGKLEFVGPDSVVIGTGTHRATVARDDLKVGPKGYRIAMSRDDLNAAVAKMVSEEFAGVAGLLKVDAVVRASDGKTILGTVGELIDDEFVLRTSSKSVILEKSLLKTDAEGLKLSMSEPEFKKAAGIRN